jgi:hypothetical protein
MKKRKPNHKEKRKEDQNKTDQIEQEHQPYACMFREIQQHMYSINHLP